MRLLTFLQTAETQKELTFDAIENEMQISPDDIESFIIEGKDLFFFLKYFKENLFFFSCTNENDSL
jgi:hypothetical protein